MPNTRKPTALHLLSGAIDKNPQRFTDRANEPTSNGPVGDAPKSFTKAKKAVWEEVVGLVPDGVLQKSDRIIIELISGLLSDLRAGEATVADKAQLRMALASIGCTPADRSRVSAAKEDLPSNDPLRFLLG